VRATEIEAANAFIRDIDPPARKARFAVDPYNLIRYRQQAVELAMPLDFLWEMLASGRWALSTRLWLPKLRLRLTMSTRDERRD